jgi:hypothetical protein
VTRIVMGSIADAFTANSRLVRGSVIREILVNVAAFFPGEGEC